MENMQQSPARAHPALAGTIETAASAGRGDDATSGDARPRGRPPTLSRERVLSAAIALSAADPMRMISVSLVARHLGVSATAIYKYFGNRDGLLQAMSARLMEDFHLAPAADADAFARIEGWFRAMRALFRRNPQLINLLSWEQGNISRAWGSHTIPILDALAELGLAGDDLAKTALWIFLTGMSTIQFEIHGRMFEAARGASDPPYVARGETGPRRVINDFRAGDDHHDDLFAFQLQRMLDALRLHARG